MAALHDPPAATQDQVACYCCGESIEASNIVRFDRHPRDEGFTSTGVVYGVPD
jgi:hypothetical protein